MNTLAYTSIFSVLLPIGLSLFQWNRLPRTWSTVRWLLVLSLLSDALSYLTGLWFKNSFPVGNLYTLLQFSFIAYIFSGFYDIKRVTRFVYTAYFVYFILDITFLESPFRFLTNANIVASLLIIILLLYYLYRQLMDITVSYIHVEPTFWLAFAFLLYYCGSFFVFLMYNHKVALASINIAMWDIWTIHNYCNISKNILIAVALWLNYRSLKSSASV